MRLDTLGILRCPYCGGHVRVREEAPLDRQGDEIVFGVLACHCARFPVVAGIAIMTIEGMSDPAREQIEAGHPDGAVRAIFTGGEDHLLAAYERIMADHALSYAEAVDALGPAFAEGRYFLYRFSDPTFIAADAVVRVIGRATLGAGDRAVDLCGGSGHLTRTLQVFTPSAVLVDWSFPKLWLARRFTAPGCEAICADAHTTLPFASRSFRFAVCSDAFHYVWTKALLAHEMERITDGGGSVAVTHAHNSLQSNASAGMPLPPAAYRELFEGSGGRVYSDAALLEDALAGCVNLAREESIEALAASPSLSVVGSRRPDLFREHRLATSTAGCLGVNPLYQPVAAASRTMRLTFPSPEYEQEYAACRTYLPDEITLDEHVIAAIDRGDEAPLADLLRRRIVLRLPERWT